MPTTIRGDAALRRKLAKLKNFKALVPTMVGAAKHVEQKIKKYPPSTFRNKPPTPYYIRGRGTQVSKNRNLGNSEDLLDKWTIKGMKGGMKQIVGNKVSYGLPVQGPKQVPLFKEIGWKTTDEVMKDEERFVLGQIHKKVDQILATG